MSEAPISFQSQAAEVELQYLGLRDLVTRAESGNIKRPPFDVERTRTRMAVAFAASQTLYELDRRRAAREGSRR